MSDGTDMQLDIEWNGGEIIATTAAEAAAGLTLGGEALLTLANRTVPHDEGVLEGSGSVAVSGLEGAVGYDTPYAERLHEHPEYDFQGGRRGKWLELTMQESGAQILDVIADQLRKAIG